MSPEAEPGMTLRQPTPSRRDPAKTAAAKTIPHDTSRDGKTESVASSLHVRPQDVADPGELREPPPHYEILRVLGEGGMGVVYLARQTSIDRTVALKMIKAEAAHEPDYRNKFLAEAVVTGELDHPNIVPIHDLGSNAAGTLFYAMKQVRGTPWSQVIGKKPLDENLDILMRVADAVAFAHSRGIIHRDLKPSNVMLGDFGEVLLMDWGLAVAVLDTAKGDRLTAETAIGGTPCYMAPEMARGDTAAIGPQSDVYLLGAMLYELVTGRPPHQAKGTMQCVQEAAENRIGPTDKKGELVEIALKAMSAEPADRYDSVKTFQKAVRTYQRHEQSITLAVHATDDLAEARATQDYDRYAESVSGYRQALKLWPENARARSGLQEARLAYAQCASDRRDYDLALSLLDPDEPGHQSLRTTVETAVRERDLRQRRLKTLKVATSISVGLAILILSVAVVWVRSARDAEAHQRKRAESEWGRAEGALADYLSEQEKREADRAASAPAFLARARKAALMKDFDDALLDLSVVLDYNPDAAAAHMLRAQILIVQGEYEEAIEVLTRCRELAPEDPNAETLQSLCRLAREDETPETMAQLAAVFREQDALTFAETVLGSSAEFLNLYRDRLAATWPWMHRGRLALNRDGKLTLGLGNEESIESLEPLRGIPLSALSAGGLRVSDLAPLADMPLEELDLTRTRVTDLSPLRGMPLRDLRLNGCEAVRNLAPLAEMPLQYLDMYECRGVTSLSALAGMPLTFLDASYVAVDDLSPLADMPLSELRLDHCRGVRDLTHLTGMPLDVLQLAGCELVTDIAPLTGMKLRELDLQNTRVADLAPLVGMPLGELRLSGTEVSSLGALAGMPLETLHLNGTAVADLEPLRGMPLRFLRLFDTPAVTNLSALAGLALEEIEVNPTFVAEGIEVLRKMPSLRKVIIGIREEPVDEFWEWYDRDVAPVQAFKAAFAAANPGLEWLHHHHLGRLLVAEEGRIVALKVWSAAVRDLALLREQPLRELVLTRACDLTDLSPLTGLPLASLRIGGCAKLSDLTHLAGLPLRSLTLEGCATEAFSALAGLPLDELALQACPGLTDLGFLRGMKLRSLDISRCERVEDLSPLAGLPLRTLVLQLAILVKDIGPLRGLPLTELDIIRTSVTDLAPLEGMPLMKLGIEPTRIRAGMEHVRAMEGLQSITVGQARPHKPRELTVAEFWKLYDAGEFGEDSDNGSGGE